jgi:hypothetical protein
MRETELRHVQSDVLDLDELAGWWMHRLNPCHPERGYRHKQAKHNGQCDNWSRGGHGIPVVYLPT